MPWFHVVVGCLFNRYRYRYIGIDIDIGIVNYLLLILLFYCCFVDYYSFTKGDNGAHY